MEETGTGEEGKEFGKQLEDSIKEVARQAMQDEFTRLKKEDAEEIIQAILPEIDSLISRRVMEHVRQVAHFMLGRMDIELKNKEE